jgi:transcriptional regulator EpsA
MTAMSPLTTRTDPDPAHFLKIAGQGAGLASHEELWRWLQGDVQQWLSHEVMLIGWGDFRSGDLQYDIVSSLPGMRSHDWTVAGIAPLISHFRDCWAAAQHQPTQLDATVCSSLVRTAGEGAAPDALSTMKTALVHGIRRTRHGTERIFVALSRQTELPVGAGNALKLLLPFIDTALRQMPPAPVRAAPCSRYDLHHRNATRVSMLSERERQIMVWVAMGKTNPEIGMILDISEFTVKNHMKSIFSKLDVTNRAQAVAKLERMHAHA